MTDEQDQKKWQNAQDFILIAITAALPEEQRGQVLAQVQQWVEELEARGEDSTFLHMLRGYYRLASPDYPQEQIHLPGANEEEDH